MTKHLFATAVCALVALLSTGLSARNYHYTPHRMLQPDSSEVVVYLYGTELYIDAESQDHYTLIKDEETGYICYALVSSDGTEYASTGIVYKGTDAPQAVRMITEPHARISKESRDKKIALKRKTLGREDDEEVSLRAATTLPDTVYGVCVLIDFQDVKSDVSVEKFETFLNADDETVFGNSMSVKRYFQWISNGKLTYINYVPSAFYTAPNTLEYYAPKDATDYTTSKFYPVVENALKSYTKEKDGFTLKDLTRTKGGAIMAINIYYAGTCPNDWATGLWPHQSQYRFNLPGFGWFTSHKYQMSDIGKELQLGTICHENGHLVCGWPDFYSYDDDNEVNNAEKYNIGDTFWILDEKSPALPNPWALDQVGWLVHKQDISQTTNGKKITLEEGPGWCAVYHGKGDESYYIEIRPSYAKTHWTVSKKGGLFIWHSNEDGDNTRKGKPKQLDCRPATDANPMWNSSNGPSVFSDESTPSARWYDGTNSDIYLWEFSDEGQTMTFRCGFPNGDPDEEENETNHITLNAYGTETPEAIYLYTVNGVLIKHIHKDKIDNYPIVEGRSDIAPGTYIQKIVYSGRTDTELVLIR